MEKIVKHFRHFGLYFMVGLRSFIHFYIYIGLGIFLAVGGLTLLISNSTPENAKSFFESTFWMFMNIGGIIITTSSFAHYGRKSMCQHLLTIPVSNTTRFLVLLIITIPLVLLINGLIFTLVADAASVFVSMKEFAKPFVFNPFTTENFSSHLIFYIQAQSLLLMSGSFFKKIGNLKTGLLVIALILFYLLINYLTSGGPIDQSFIGNLYAVITSDNYQYARLREFIPTITILYNIFVWLLVPFAWYIVYLRFKEMEV